MNKDAYKNKKYLFCGVGGSGMRALATVLCRKGAHVYGSDRSYDRGLFPTLYKSLGEKGVQMVPQDGSGVTQGLDYLVVSSAVEDSILDVKAAKEKNIPIIKRAELLAELSNAATSITVGGTNGKSTITGMIGWMLHECGQSPTVINGAAMINFARQSAIMGESDLMVLETDESDGSITNFHAEIAVLSNISQDHKEMDELEMIFGRYLSQAKHHVLNADCPNVARLAQKFPDAQRYSMKEIPEALALMVPGKHNVSNALAALKVAEILGVDQSKAIAALNRFQGIVSRLEVVGKTASDITVIDDFGHNPDKISASLKTLQETGKRLLVMYQPHGFGPTIQQREGLVASFSDNLKDGDLFFMPEIYYAGGTANKTISSQDIIKDVQSKGRVAYFYETKDEIAREIKTHVKTGDIICIMGARDDSLREMARNLFKTLNRE